MTSNPPLIRTDPSLWVDPRVELKWQIRTYGAMGNQYLQLSRLYKRRWPESGMGDFYGGLACAFFSVAKSAAWTLRSMVQYDPRRWWQVNTWEWKDGYRSYRVIARDTGGATRLLQVHAASVEEAIQFAKERFKGEYYGLDQITSIKES